MAAGNNAGGGSAAAVKAGRAFVELFVDDKNLSTGLAKAKSHLMKWGKGIGLAGTALFAAGGAFLTGLGFLGKSALDTGGQLADMSERLGVAVEDLSALGYAAELAGSGLEDVEVAIGKMQNAIAEGKQVGDLNMGGLLGLSFSDQINAVAEAIKDIEDPTLRGAAAVEIFGKSGRKMIPFLSEGAEGMAKFRAEASRISGLDAGKVKILDNVGDALTKIASATKSIGTSIALALFGDGTAIESAAESFVDLVASIRNFISENQALVTGVAAGAAAITVLGAALIAIGGAAIALGAVVSAIGTIVAFGPAIFVVAGALMAIVPAAILLGRYLSMEGVGSSFKSVWGGILDALKSGDLSTAAKIAFTGLKLEWFKAITAMTPWWLRIASPAANLIGGFADAEILKVKSELDALLAQAKNAAAKAKTEVAASVAAVGQSIFNGPSKGGFGTASDLKQQLGYGDQVKVNNAIVNTEKNTKETADALKKAGPLVWAV